MHDSVVLSQPLNLKFAVYPTLPLIRLCAAGRVYLRQNQGHLSSLQGFTCAAIALCGFTLTYQTLDKVADGINSSQHSYPVSQLVSYEPPNWGHPAQTTGSATR